MPAETLPATAAETIDLTCEYCGADFTDTGLHYDVPVWVRHVIEFSNDFGDEMVVGEKMDEEENLDKVGDYESQVQCPKCGKDQTGDHRTALLDLCEGAEQIF